VNQTASDTHHVPDGSRLAASRSNPNNRRVCLPGAGRGRAPRRCSWRRS